MDQVELKRCAVGGSAVGIGSCTLVAVPNCIFCDQPFAPDRPRSQEHAAPRWCRDLLPDLGPAVHTHTVITADGRTDADHGERDVFTTVCGDVCRECNTGWMHELEESAKPILRNLITGDSRRLKFWRQTLAATWATKTAMVWDSVVPQHHTIPRSALHTFHRTQRLNLRQQVWIGRYVGSQPHHSFRQTAAHVVGPVTGGLEDPNEAHAYIAALSVGQLAFVVYGHVLGVPYRFDPPAAVSPKLVDVWPPTEEVVAWPPAEALTDDDLEMVVYSLGLPMEQEGNQP